MNRRGDDYLQALFDGVSDLADRDLRENVAQLWFVAVGAIDALAKTGALDLEDSTNWLQRFGAVTGQPERIPDARRQDADAAPAITPRSTPVRRAVPVLRELSSVQIVAVESSSSWVLVRWQPLAEQTHARDVSLEVLVDDDEVALEPLQTLMFPIARDVLIGISAYKLRDGEPEVLVVRYEDEELRIDLGSGP